MVNMLKIQRIIYAQVQVIDAHVYIFILYFGSHSVKCKDSIQFRVLGGFAGKHIFLLQYLNQYIVNIYLPIR